MPRLPEPIFVRSGRAYTSYIRRARVLFITASYHLPKIRLKMQIDLCASFVRGRLERDKGRDGRQDEEVNGKHDYRGPKKGDTRPSVDEASLEISRGP